MESIYENVDSDEILDAMRSDPSTARFAGARTREIIVETLKDEREGHITLLADELAKRNSECEFLRVEINKQKRELQLHLQNAKRQKDREAEVEKRVREEFAQMQRMNDQQVARAQELERTVELVRKEKQTEKDEMRAALLKLTKLIAKQKQNLATSKLLDSMEDDFLLKSGSVNMEHSLETLLITLENSFESQVRTMQEADERFQSLRKSQEAAIAKLQQSQDQLTQQVRDLRAREDVLSRELEAAHQESRSWESKLLTVSDELRQKEAAHASSEKERLEVRNQYLAIGEKLKEILNKEERQTSSKVRALEDEKQALEAKVLELNRALQESVTEAKGIREENEHLLRDAGSKRQIETLEQDLTASLSELAQAKRQLEEARLKADEEKRRIEESFREERRRLESGKDSALREKEAQMERHYEKLMREKEQSLRESERMAKMNLRAKKEEAARVSEAINDRMLSLSQDYISRVQHNEILNATRSQLEAQISAQAVELNERHGAEIRMMEETMENEAVSQLTQASASLKDKILRLETELTREKKERLDAEKAVDEERSKLVRTRHRCEQEERSKSAAVEQLSAATQVIDRLKAMVEEQREKLRATTAALKAGQEKLSRLNQQAEGKEMSTENLRLQNDEQGSVIRRYEKKISSLESKVRSLGTALEDAKSAVEANENSHAEEVSNLTNDLILAREKGAQSATKLQQQMEAYAQVRDALKVAEKAKNEITTNANKQRIQGLRDRAALQAKVMQGLQEIRSLREALKLTQTETDFQLKGYKSYMEQELNRVSWTLSDALRGVRSQHQSQLQVLKDEQEVVVRKIKAEHEREMQSRRQDIVRLEHELADVKQSNTAGEAHQDRLINSLKRESEEKSGQVNELMLEAASLKDQVSESEGRLQETRRKLESVQSVLEQADQKSAQDTEAFRELEKTLELHLANFTSILVALSAEIDLPQELMDALLEVDNVKFQGALRQLTDIIHTALDSLSQSVKREASSGAELLQKKERELETAVAALGKAQSQLEEFEAETKRLKSTIDDLKAQEVRLSRENAQKVELTTHKANAQLQQIKRQLEESMSSHKHEKEELEKRHKRAMDRLEERHKRETDDLSADFQRKEKALASQVEQERVNRTSAESKLQAAENKLELEKEKSKVQSDYGASRDLFRSTLQRTQGEGSNTSGISTSTPSRRSWRTGPSMQTSSPLRRTSRNVQDLRELLSRSMALDSELEAFSSQLSVGDFGNTSTTVEPREQKTNISFEAGPLDLTLGDVQLKVESANSVTVEGSNSLVMLSPKRGSGSSVKMSRHDL